MTIQQPGTSPEMTSGGKYTKYMPPRPCYSINIIAQIIKGQLDIQLSQLESNFSNL
jgi:hypothetical protein